MGVSHSASSVDGAGLEGGESALDYQWSHANQGFNACIDPGVQMPNLLSRRHIILHDQFVAALPGDPSKTSSSDQLAVLSHMWQPPPVLASKYDDCFARLAVSGSMTLKRALAFIGDQPDGHRCFCNKLGLSLTSTRKIDRAEFRVFMHALAHSQAKRNVSTVDAFLACCDQPVALSGPRVHMPELHTTSKRRLSGQSSLHAMPRHNYAEYNRPGKSASMCEVSVRSARFHRAKVIV